LRTCVVQGLFLRAETHTHTHACPFFSLATVNRHTHASSCVPVCLKHMHDIPCPLLTCPRPIAQLLWTPAMFLSSIPTLYRCTSALSAPTRVLSGEHMHTAVGLRASNTGVALLCQHPPVCHPHHLLLPHHPCGACGRCQSPHQCLQHTPTRANLAIGCESPDHCRSRQET
jgi:hypothetical protein